MAICRWAGISDLFITMMCNPKWHEIQRHLQENTVGHLVSERPDIVARVFKIKLDELMKDIRKKHHFGVPKAVLYTIEFQKCGLPHCHILVFLSQADKISSPDEIDRFISAELPSESGDPIGFLNVGTHMMHGPCGNLRPSSRCMNDGKCTNGFPKSYCDENFIRNDGWSSYRRRNNSRKVHVGRQDIMLDNGYVVHYNRALLIKYGCHINVEWCNQGMLVKYLFSYINKGQDRATAVLEGQAAMSKFTEWMAANERYDFGRKLTYAEYPTLFTWHEKERVWEPHKGLFQTIGRIYYVSPTMGEKYYLRMLLNVVRGPRGFKEIRTVDGVEHPTYMSACKALSLLGDDVEWVDAVHQAYHWQFGDRLHAEILNYTMKEIEQVLIQSGRSLSSFPTLPQIDHTSEDRFINRLVQFERVYDANEERTHFIKQYAGLNSQQKEVFDSIYSVVQARKAGVFFVLGSGGTGKTFLWTTLIARIRSNNEIVLTVASSGIASLLLPGGRTTHSRFRIPIEVDKDSCCAIDVG
ncbi:uncharacterized protein LOC110928801 [Helianthus annuus]|uniref:uncharacterized protein LOC110928801 n=1 Tax=Helianthus annuus TaxID=4232 RepID=UPI00165333C8|nr:uncharacterized protein LOC110928801 [Helianthus annuus]